MHSDQLHYLITLSQNPSMNIASQELHITPSALSISIKNLENELHMQLVRRTTRGVTLTAYGKEVVRLAEAFFDGLDKVQDESAHSQQAISGECLIYTVQGAVDNLLPKVLSQLYSTHPQLHVTAEAASITDIYAHAKGTEDDPHELSLLYVRDPSAIPPEVQAVCTFTPLTQVKLMAQIHQRFPVAHDKNPTLKTLLNYPLIIYHPLSVPVEANPTLNMLSTIAKPRKVILESNYAIYQGLIQQGIGIGFDVVSPLLSLNPPIMENIHNILLKNGPTFYLGYLQNNLRPLSLPAQTFLDTLLEFVKRNDFSNK